MSAWCKCSNGHKYLQYDVPNDDVLLGAPACPHCRVEWIKEQLGRVRRVEVGPKDTLVFNYDGVIPIQEIDRIKKYLAGIFPDNEVLFLGHGIKLSIVGALRD